MASHGRRFFFHKESGRIARLILDDYNCVCVIDDYTEKCIRIRSSSSAWRGFSHGGTMRAIILDLAAYVSKGTPMPLHHFGPWPQWMSVGGDNPWGYEPKQMTACRIAIHRALGVSS
jgi:hypothetical protein